MPKGFLTRIPLIPKMLFITIVVGAAAWGALDYFQSQKAKALFDEYLIEQLKQQAHRDRVRFDNYIEKYHQASRLIISQHNFQEYASKLMKPCPKKRRIGMSQEIPPWLPDAAIMRHFVPLRYALLIGPDGCVRDIYSSTPVEMPVSLRSPSDVIRKLSHNQALLTYVEGKPYFVGSESLVDGRGNAIATIMLASPLDSEFLAESQRTSSSLIALVSQGNNIVLASSNPDEIPVGKGMSEIERDYRVIGKSFFDWGASELTVQFMSFASKREIEKIGRSILRSERYQRAFTALAVIACIAVIMFWIAKNIRAVTEEITDFSRSALNGRVSEKHGGDELILLKDQFGTLANEVVEARKKLQHQAEELLREKTVYLDNILHSSTMAMIATDMQMRVKYFNGVAERYCDTKARDAVGKTLFQTNACMVFNMDELERAIIEAKLGGQPVITGQKEGDGGTAHLEARVSGIRDNNGQMMGYLIAISDVTKRVRAEEALRASEELFRELAENISDVFFVRDLKTRKIIYLSPAYEQVWGRPRQEMYDDSYKFMNAVHPDDYKRVLDAIKNQENGVYFNEIYRIVKSGGEVRWVHSRTYPVRDASGNVYRLAGIAEDITKEKYDERMLMEYAAELEKSNRELEHFAYVASHDMQEPLRKVASFTELFALKYQGKLDETAQKYIHYIVDGATRMHTLINDLLAYSRLTTRTAAFAPVDANAVVDAVCDDLQFKIKECGAIVTHGTLPVVSADPVQLGQVFQNLIINALKFRGDKPPVVRIEAENKGVEWRFSVGDNGIGMEAEHLGRIFLMFQRLHTRQEYPGTGIGLAICKKIIERHGGRIWAESRPGQGSTFYFTLPVRQGAAGQ